jgi:hypothetical protein
MKKFFHLFRKRNIVTPMILGRNKNNKLEGGNIQSAFLIWKEKLVVFTRKLEKKQKKVSSQRLLYSPDFMFLSVVKDVDEGSTFCC